MPLEGRGRQAFLVVVLLAVVSIYCNSTTLSEVKVSVKPASVETEPSTPAARQEPTKPFLPPRNASFFRPVTSLSRECDPTPNQPLRSIATFADFDNASRYFQEDISVSLPTANSTTGLAVCEFVARDNAMHFAHTMQQLYGCWSFWKAHNGRRPILLMPSNSVQVKLDKNAFLKGFFQLLKDSSEFQLEIMSKSEFNEQYDTTSSSNIVRTTINISGAGYILTHAKELSNLFLAAGNSTSNPSTTTTFCRSSPRVGVLNRRKAVGRSIVNTPKLVEILLSDDDDDDENVGYKNVSVEYFEEKTFQEQVGFFTNVDILVAPHGAQLTGLAFLQSACSQVLELFPKGYALPNFYGSLATNAGIGYSYLYLSDQPWQTEQAETLSQRIQARGSDLCPSPQIIAVSIKELVAKWEQCCASKKEEAADNVDAIKK